MIKKAPLLRSIMYELSSLWPSSFFPQNNTCNFPCRVTANANDVILPDVDKDSGTHSMPHTNQEMSTKESPKMAQNKYNGHLNSKL